MVRVARMAGNRPAAWLETANVQAPLSEAIARS
jgi:hypothetical protein